MPRSLGRRRIGRGRGGVREEVVAPRGELGRQTQHEAALLALDYGKLDPGFARHEARRELGTEIAALDLDPTHLGIDLERCGLDGGDLRRRNDEAQGSRVPRDRKRVVLDHEVVIAFP